MSDNYFALSTVAEFIQSYKMMDADGKFDLDYGVCIEAIDGLRIGAANVRSMMTRRPRSW